MGAAREPLARQTNGMNPRIHHSDHPLLVPAETGW
jgi:hypothetical protein